MGLGMLTSSLRTVRRQLFIIEVLLFLLLLAVILKKS
jgi:hypothetical protein